MSLSCRSPRWRLAAAATAAALLSVGLAGCTDDPAPATPAPVAIGWTEVSLPTPPGPPGRLAVRDVVSCGDRWYVSGAVFGADGETRPAAWVSPDRRQWRSLVTVPAPNSYYGPRHVLYAAACRDGALTVIGGKSGGAHGNPRVSTWHQRPDGALVEELDYFELYGGPKAVSVGRIAGGAGGWLIAGNRTSGAAVWHSTDSIRFEIVEAAPHLSSDPQHDTAAADAVADGTGWTVVGGTTITGRTDRDPLVWTSADARQWRRVTLPADNTYEELQRVTTLGAEQLAVGLRGPTFGAWRGRGQSWTAAGRFGATGSGGTAFVRSVSVAGDRVLVTSSDGAAYRLWLSTDRGDGWRPATLPGEHPSGSERAVVVAGAGPALVLLTDDARSGRVWVADLTGA